MVPKNKKMMPRQRIHDLSDYNSTLTPWYGMARHVSYNDHRHTVRDDDPWSLRPAERKSGESVTMLYTSAVLNAIVYHNVDQLEMYLRYRTADINGICCIDVNHHPLTPIDLAHDRADVHVIRFLLEHGAMLTERLRSLAQTLRFIQRGYVRECDDLLVTAYKRECTNVARWCMKSMGGVWPDISWMVCDRMTRVEKESDYDVAQMWKHKKSMKNMKLK